MSRFAKNRFSRRAVLRTAGAGTALLPLVPMLEAEAQGAAGPKRIVFVYSSNGTVHERWVPQMNGGELELSFILQPLAAHSSRLLVIDGLDYTACDEKGDRKGHYGGMNTALTGTASRFVDPGNSTRTAPLGPSVDQHIASAVSEGLRFRSLELGVQVGGHISTRHVNWAGPAEPLPPENDPAAVFERVFRDLVPSGSNPAPDPRAIDRSSILDFVRGDLGRVRDRLGAHERHKMDAHLESVRRVEQALLTGTGSASTDSCQSPAISSGLDANVNDNIPQISRVQIDLMVMALACDLTRVGTIQYGRAGAQHRFSWLGPEFRSDPDNGPNDSTSGIHGLAHNEENSESRDKLARCHQWYAGEMAYLLDALAAIPEGSGTMLDNTLVVWMNELGTGSHSLRRTPWVIGGNVGNFFRSGRLVQVSDQPHNRLLVSLCQAMGLDDQTFGDSDYGTALTDLE